MDDTSPKPTNSQSNIDDLVKELSRPQNLPPASPSPQASSPKPITPPPAAPQAPKPATPATPPPAPNAPKEYQSSIRTMSDDLAKIKSGQQPQGVNIPRTITPPPAAPQAPKPATPATPPPAPNKPLPGASLPPSMPSASLPKSPIPPVGPIPTIPKAEAKPEVRPQFSMPATTESAPASSRGKLFAFIALGAVVLGALYWFFLVREPQVDDVPDASIVTFTPRPTATPNLGISGVFPDEDGTITLPTNSTASTLKSGIEAQASLSPGKFARISVQGTPIASGSMPFSFSVWDVLKHFVDLKQGDSPFITGLEPASISDNAILLYGQQESYDSAGKVVPGVSKRLVLVSEYVSGTPADLMAQLKTQEPKMTEQLSTLFSLDKSKNKSGAFIDSMYKGVSLRYKNFPYPDRSIDYTVLTHNNKNYLIFSNSREAMLRAIDAFLVSGK